MYTFCFTVVYSAVPRQKHMILLGRILHHIRSFTLHTLKITYSTVVMQNNLFLFLKKHDQPEEADQLDEDIDFMFDLGEIIELPAE